MLLASVGEVLHHGIIQSRESERNQLKKSVGGVGGSSSSIRKERVTETSLVALPRQEQTFFSLVRRLTL